MYYKTLPASKKISLSRSMHVWIGRFFEQYHLKIYRYKKIDELTNDIYFYWLRNCAENDYLWCKKLSNKALEDEFHQELKKKLKRIVLSYLSESFLSQAK